MEEGTARCIHLRTSQGPSGVRCSGKATLYIISSGMLPIEIFSSATPYTFWEAIFVSMPAHECMKEFTFEMTF